MHRSKLAGFIIDCQGQDLEGAALFWGSALGMAVKSLPGDEGRGYRQLLDPSGKLIIEVQTVTHPSRLHLDIEADDIDAEVRRLERLGATRVARIKSWWVMEAPTGHRFCVIAASSSDFKQQSREWPS